MTSPQPGVAPQGAPSQALPPPSTSGKRSDVFDPTQHQAMFEIEDAERPSGTVAEVVQAGYSIGERVLRPAMVGVSTGGPKQAPNGGNGNGQT